MAREGARLDMVLANLRELAGELQRSFDARYLALALTVPAFEVFRRISFTLPLAVAGASSPGACVAACALGFLAAAACALGRGIRGRQWQARRTALAAAALAVVAALAMAPAALGALPALAGILGVGGYGAAGAALCLLVLGWVSVLAACEPRATLVHVGCALVLGSLAMPLVIAIQEAPGLLALLACCLVVCAGALAGIGGYVRPRGKEETPSVGVQTSVPVLGDPAEAPTLRELARSGLGGAAVGLTLTMFSWGVIAIPPMQYLYDHKWWVLLAGSSISLVVIGALVYALRKDAGFRATRQKTFFLLPVFAVFLSYFSFIRMLDARGVLKDLLSVGYNISVAGFFTLFVASVAARVREKGLSAECAAGPGLVACTLFYGLGVALFEAYGNNAMYFQIVFTTLYIVGLAFISTRQASLNDDSRLAERCGAVASRAELSGREAEILQLVVAGYSVARIAEELTISPGTVRTHKKRIYAKLDVHSHDELMRRVRSGR